MAQAFLDRLGWIPKSASLNSTLRRAFVYASEQSHREVTLEHTLLALTEDTDAEKVLQACAVDVSSLRNAAAGFISQAFDRLPPSEIGAPIASPELISIMNHASAAANDSQRPEMDGAIVLAAMISEGRSPAAELLRQNGLAIDLPAADDDGAPQFDDPVEPDPSTEIAEPAPAEEQSVDDILSEVRDRIEGETGYSVPVSQAALPPQAAIPHTHPDQTTPVDRTAPRAAGAQSAVPPTQVPTQPSAHDGLQAIQQHPTSRPAPPPGDLAVRPPMNGHVSEPHNPARRLPPTAQGHVPQSLHQSRQGGRPVPQAGQPPHQNGMPPMNGASTPQRPPQGTQPRPLHRSANGHGASMGAPTGAPMNGANGHRPSASAMPPPTQPQNQNPNQNQVQHHPGQGNPPVQPTSAPSAQPQPGAQPAGSPPVHPVELRELPGSILLEAIPERLVSKRTERAHIHIKRRDLEKLAASLPQSELMGHKASDLVQAVTVRLRAPGRTIGIEPESPETQWIQGGSHHLTDDQISWRWAITGRDAGSLRLTAEATTRTVVDGRLFEASLPEQTFDIKVTRPLQPLFMRVATTVILLAAGAAAALFTPALFEMATDTLAALAK